jgi:hypothetical protein
MKPVCSANGMKLRRRDAAAFRMAPAQQGFDGDDAPAGQRQLGLVGEREFAGRQRAAHVADQGQLLGAGSAPALARTRYRMAPLGRRQRQLGAPQQGAGVEAVLRIQRDADAAADVEALAVQRDRVAQLRPARRRRSGARRRRRRLRAGRRTGRPTGAPPCRPAAPALAAARRRRAAGGRRQGSPARC